LIDSQTLPSIIDSRNGANLPEGLPNINLSGHIGMISNGYRQYGMPLSVFHEYRLRVGRWRVFFTDSFEILYIEEGKKRNENTY
jgi:hypothetical protein